MTPLRPVRFTVTCQIQIDKISETDENAPKDLLDEAHNYISRLRRPYPDNKNNGITITPIRIKDVKNYFNYRRTSFRYSFDFEAPETGYIYVGKIYVKNKNGKNLFLQMRFNMTFG